MDRKLPTNATRRIVLAARDGISIDCDPEAVSEYELVVEGRLVAVFSTPAPFEYDENDQLTNTRMPVECFPEFEGEVEAQTRIKTRRALPRR